MKEERISVIVPAYNVGQWLPRCLDSLLAQEHANLEIVLVDDGSTDHTWKVIEEYKNRYTNILALRKENGGVTSARLAGIAQATGEWIGFVDGDDQVEPWMYRKLLENARKYHADISHCGHQIVFPDGRVESVHGTKRICQQNRLAGQRDLLDGSQIDSSLCSKLFRKELFRGLEDWMEPGITNNEDFFMNFFLFSKAENSVYEDVCPYRYLLRKGSASYHCLHEHSIFDPIRVRQMILERCDPELREQAHNALMRNMLFAYARLAVEPDQAFDGFRVRVRQMLQEQRAYFGLLSARNRLLAKMICTAPWTFHISYRLYKMLFQREEQH